MILLQNELKWNVKILRMLRNYFLLFIKYEYAEGKKTFIKKSIYDRMYLNLK